jgi:hypothetical protein
MSPAAGVGYYAMEVLGSGHGASDAHPYLTVVDITPNGVAEHHLEGKSAYFSLVDGHLVTDKADACGEPGTICEWTNGELKLADADVRSKFQTIRYVPHKSDGDTGWNVEPLSFPTEGIQKKTLTLKSGNEELEFVTTDKATLLSVVTGQQKRTVLSRHLAPQLVSPVKYLEEFH